MSPAPQPLRAYRIVHIDSLPSILKYGTYASRHVPEAVRAEGGYKQVADAELTTRRDSRVVPVDPGGTIGDYVPFYFGKRGPFLFCLKHGYGASSPVAESDLVYLVANVEQVAATGRFAFTDTHAYNAQAQFFNDLADVSKLDWSCVQALQWTNTQYQPYRKARKQAEFLLWGLWPPEQIAGIVTFDEASRTKVEQIVLHSGRSTPVVSRSDGTWYYR